MEGRGWGAAVVVVYEGALTLGTPEYRWESEKGDVVSSSSS